MYDRKISDNPFIYSSQKQNNATKNPLQVCLRLLLHNASQNRL